MRNGQKKEEKKVDQQFLKYLDHPVITNNHHRSFPF